MEAEPTPAVPAPAPALEAAAVPPLAEPAPIETPQEPDECSDLWAKVKASEEDFEQWERLIAAALKTVCPPGRPPEAHRTACF